MLNHHLQISRSRVQKFLVKSKTVPLSQPKTKSIFSVENQHQTKNLQQMGKDSSKVNAYQICGDQEFKRKYLSNLITEQKTQQINNAPNDSFFKEQKEGKNQSQTNSFLDKKLKQSIYNNQSHANNFLTKLSKTQKNIVNRQNLSLQKFSQAKQKWEKIDEYLKLRIPKSQTVTFGSVNKIYIHENPQKDQLINDMIPQYWRNSLRNNDKKLKSYLKGHHFKNEQAEQMLQTLKGINKIQKSIPKIGIERIAKVFEKNKSLGLKATKLTNEDGSQTMRQYHKSMHQTLNENLKERSLENSKNRRFSHKSQLTTFNNLNEDSVLLENVKQNQRKIYFFCKDLEKLDKIDQEIYKKNYDKKSKWILQGLEVAC